MKLQEAESNKIHEIQFLEEMNTLPAVEHHIHDEVPLEMILVPSYYDGSNYCLLTF